MKKVVSIPVLSIQFTVKQKIHSSTIDRLFTELRFIKDQTSKDYIAKRAALFAELGITSNGDLLTSLSMVQIQLEQRTLRKTEQYRIISDLLEKERNFLEDVPDEFNDEITATIMLTPVLLPSGKSIDLSTYNQHIKTCLDRKVQPKDPFGRQSLPKVPQINLNLKESIDKFLKCNPQHDPRVISKYSSQLAQNEVHPHRIHRNPTENIKTAEEIQLEQDRKLAEKLQQQENERVSSGRFSGSTGFNPFPIRVNSGPNFTPVNLFEQPLNVRPPFGHHSYPPSYLPNFSSYSGGISEQPIRFVSRSSAQSDPTFRQLYQFLSQGDYDQFLRHFQTCPEDVTRYLQPEPANSFQHSTAEQLLKAFAESAKQLFSPSFERRLSSGPHRGDHSVRYSGFAKVLSFLMDSLPPGVMAKKCAEVSRSDNQTSLIHYAIRSGSPDAAKTVWKDFLTAYSTQEKKCAALFDSFVTMVMNTENQENARMFAGIILDLAKIQPNTYLKESGLYKALLNGVFFEEETRFVHLPYLSEFTDLFFALLSTDSRSQTSLKAVQQSLYRFPNLAILERFITFLESGGVSLKDIRYGEDEVSIITQYCEYRRLWEVNEESQRVLLYLADKGRCDASATNSQGYDTFVQLMVRGYFKPALFLAEQLDIDLRNCRYTEDNLTIPDIYFKVKGRTKIRLPEVKFFYQEMGFDVDMPLKIAKGGHFLHFMVQHPSLEQEEVIKIGAYFKTLNIDTEKKNDDGRMFWEITSDGYYSSYLVILDAIKNLSCFDKDRISWASQQFGFIERHRKPHLPNLLIVMARQNCGKMYEWTIDTMAASIMDQYSSNWSWFDFESFINLCAQENVPLPKNLPARYVSLPEARADYMKSVIQKIPNLDYDAVYMGNSAIGFCDYALEQKIGKDKEYFAMAKLLIGLGADIQNMPQLFLKLLNHGEYQLCLQLMTDNRVPALYSYVDISGKSMLHHFSAHIRRIFSTGSLSMLTVPKDDASALLHMIKLYRKNRLCKKDSFKDSSEEKAFPKDIKNLWEQAIKEEKKKEKASKKSTHHSFLGNRGYINEIVN